jgi:hypothetical protein
VDDGPSGGDRWGQVDLAAVVGARTRDQPFGHRQ